MEKKSLVPGIILIAIGLLFLADNLNFIWIDWEDIWYDFWSLWPLAILVGGVLFWLGWFKNRDDYGLLMPGTIMIVYGLLFWYCMEFGWWHMGDDHLWSFFIIGPGLGFLAMYALGKQEKGFLVSGLILALIGGIFLIGTYFWDFIIPALLILIGVRLLMKGKKRADMADGAASVDNAK